MPIITISRQYGSGGSEVAERVATALGWALLDNELVDEVARRTRMTPQAVQAIEERVPSLAERLADALAFSTAEYAVAYPAEALQPNEEVLLEVTRRVIEEAIGRGPVVIVGRGAQSSLAQRTDALHVYCHSPHDALVRRTMERELLSEADARRKVDEVNHRRDQYVRRHWHRGWAAMENYHLCVNTAWLGIEGSAEAVIELARKRFGVGA